MIDLTSLEGKDTEGKIKQMCFKATQLHEALNVPNVAAVCVYPNMVGVAKHALRNSNVNVASVATAYPWGMSRRGIKLAYTKMALDSGTEEMDMMISRSKF